MPSLTRLARRLVPAGWRDAVERDLADEAARRGLYGTSARLWVAGHLVRVGIAFRWRTAPRVQAVGRRGPDRWMVDARHAWRALRARPGASIGTIAVLTIGVGLATIIFALTDPFLLRPLPYRDPERLVIMRIEAASTTSPFEAPRRTVGTDVPTLAEWQARADLFENVAAYGVWDRVRLATSQGAASLAVWTVSPNFLEMLGGQQETTTATRPAPPGAPRLLVVTATTSQVRLGLEGQTPTTLGAEWQRERRDSLATIVPAMAEEFLFPSTALGLRPDAVTPIEFGTVAWQSGSGQDWLTGLLARLQPGISPHLVKATLDPRLASSGLQLVVEPLATHLSATFRPLALGALAAGLLIAMACLANVMNLLVAHGVYRSQDFATRRALGASDVDLIRLIGLEMAAIGLVTAGAGLLAARFGLTAIAQIMPAEYGALGQPAMTSRVALFTGTLTGTMAFGSAIPAWLSTRSTSSAAISRTRQGEPRMASRWRFLLTAGQTMVAVVLLVGATMLVRSYANLWLQHTGYSPDARLVDVSYPSSRGQAQFVDTMAATMDALRRVPGIASVAAGVGVGPLLDRFGGGGGPTIRAGALGALMAPAQISADYFQVVGTPMLAGRSIGALDRGWDAVVVNRSFAQRAWPDLSVHEVVGQPITRNGQPGRVVGIVGDMYTRALDVPPGPRLYQPIDAPTGPRRLSFAVRLVEGASVPETAIRRAVTAVDADAVVEQVDSAYGRLADSVRDRTFAALVLGLFAIAGVGVTAAGIFAVVAFVAARRTREIAIRVALGARSADVQRLVVRDAVLATAAGGAVGLTASRWLGRAIESQLYGVTAEDWTTPLLAIAVLVGVTALAAWWPAKRALAVPPTAALRVE